MLASRALGNGFERGENPYQDFADLLGLCNCLVHLKPKELIETEDNGEIRFHGRGLIARLRSKSILQKNT